jgi:hypothetical protein
MTGISQCQDTLNFGVAASPLSVAERASCLKDPRYLTWRMMTLKLNYKGNQQWYRTDSYWDRAAFQMGSSWGPGAKLSTHFMSNNDNNGLTDLGKTYVFALGDGSGFALHHLAFDTYAPSDHTVPGVGTNVIVNEKASYTNTFPNQYSMDFCAATNLEVAGSASTEDFTDAVKAWTDGYYMRSTISMKQQHAGDTDSWQGTCLVYYTSQYVQDNTEGSLCHVVLHDSTATAGPQDFGSSSVIHVPAASWYPPQREGSVSPAGLALTDDKYGITYTPNVVVANVLTVGYYASAFWYQPVSASEYDTMKRYGRGDLIAAYCMQGSGSTSYFQQHTEPMALTGAMVLIAGTAVLASTVMAI